MGGVSRCTGAAQCRPSGLLQTPLFLCSYVPQPATVCRAWFINTLLRCRAEVSLIHSFTPPAGEAQLRRQPNQDPEPAKRASHTPVDDDNPYEDLNLDEDAAAPQHPRPGPVNDDSLHGESDGYEAPITVPKVPNKVPSHDPLHLVDLMYHRRAHSCS